MNNVKKSRLKWITLALMALVLLISTLYIVDRITRCTTNGLARNDALKIADKKLKIQFRDHPSLDNFVLVGEQFDDKSWMFTYQFKDCVVDIIIDRCGVADVGGLSEGCDMRGQKNLVK